MAGYNLKVAMSHFSSEIKVQFWNSTHYCTPSVIRAPREDTNAHHNTLGGVHRKGSYP